MKLTLLLHSLSLSYIFRSFFSCCQPCHVINVNEKEEEENLLRYNLIIIHNFFFALLQATTSPLFLNNLRKGFIISVVLFLSQLFSFISFFHSILLLLCDTRWAWNQHYYRYNEIVNLFLLLYRSNHIEFIDWLRLILWWMWNHK